MSEKKTDGAWPRPFQATAIAAHVDALVRAANDAHERHVEREVVTLARLRQIRAALEAGNPAAAMAKTIEAIDALEDR